MKVVFVDSEDPKIVAATHEMFELLNSMELNGPEIVALCGIVLLGVCSKQANPEESRQEALRILTEWFAEQEEGDAALPAESETNH